MYYLEIVVLTYLKKGYSKFLGMTFPYYIDAKGNRYLNIKTVAALSGRQRNSVDMFFRKRDAMLRVGYRPKHFGGRPMKSKFGVAHVNENLIPFFKCHDLHKNQTRT